MLEVSNVPDLEKQIDLEKLKHKSLRKEFNLYKEMAQSLVLVSRKCEQRLCAKASSSVSRIKTLRPSC